MSARPRVEALYPLSPSQTGMWLQSMAEEGSRRFVEQAAFCLEGRFDRAALERALQFVVGRHAALRSAILTKGHEPVRAVLQEMPLRLHEVDARCDDEDAALTRLMEAERQRGFPLNRPPLIRFALLQIGAERAWLVVSFHHIILDGWSLLVLWTEAAAFYAAELAGTAVQVPPAPDDRAAADWLSARLESASETFWRSRLAGFSAPTRLARLLPDTARDEPDEIEHLMSAAAGTAIAAVSQACRVSAAIVFEVLWAVLIAGRTRAADVAFAATVSGRPPGVPGIERMVGCFINTVPIRIRLQATETLRALLSRHHEERVVQAEFEYCAAGQIHGWSELPPGEPLCQSLMVYENLRAPGSGEAAGTRAPATERRVRGARTGYPLAVLISPGSAPHLRFIYQPRGMSSTDVRELAVGLERLAAQIADWLDRPVEEWRDTIDVVPPPDAAPAVRPAARFVAPRTRLEHQLAGIWEGLFRTAPIGVLDDFFSLGGHSLLALQMAARIRAQVGVELPLHVLIAEATIEKLARVCSGESAEEDALVPLSSGGTGMPIYCIHPLGGHVLCYAALGKSLGGEHACWGLQARGLRQDERPAAAWSDLVAHHWALLREARHDAASAGHWLDGVALVGYSFGGYIAMDLAARALQEGATLVRVVLLDVPHPSAIPDDLRLPDAATLLHALFGHALGLELAQLQRVPADELVRHVYDSAVAQHVLPPDASFEQVARVLEVATAHSRLEPPRTRYGFPITLLRAREGASRISSRPDFGWGDYAGPLTIEWVDGSHETLLEPHHAAAVATLIAKHLR